MQIMIGKFLLLFLDIFFWIIIVQVIMSWLIAFDVINVRNAQAQNLIKLMTKLTDPIYKPLRKFIPSIAGIDFTPIIIIFGISLAKNAVASIFLF